MIHTLKTVNPYFEDILNRKKQFEFRYNDRNFQIGDHIILLEFDNLNNTYSGRKISCVIKYILPSYQGLLENYVIIGFTIFYVGT